jgi:uncharacterized protein YhdP
VLPVFEKALGSIQFTEAGFNLAGINAQFLGGPIKLEGGTRKLAPRSTEANPLIFIQGQVTANGLRQAKEIPALSLLAQYANGASNYTASLGFKGGQSELKIQSQLQGMAISLPAPLHKRAEEQVAFTFENLVQGLSASNPSTALRDQLQLTWGRSLSATYLRDVSGADPRVIQGRWQVGENFATPGVALAETGVTASFNLPSFSVDDWVQVL